MGRTRGCSSTSYNAQDSPTQPGRAAHIVKSSEAEKTYLDENMGSKLRGPGFKSQLGHFLIL